jgi:glycerol kinase
LTGGEVHATDPSNASRTMLFDIGALSWSTEMCSMLGVPLDALPAVCPSSGHIGVTSSRFGAPAGIPISGVAGDQQAALFGQACWQEGMAKNTYGTGSFVLLNIGSTCPTPIDGLLTSVGWTIGDGPATYVLEGSIFVTGAAVQWLRDELRIIDSSAEVEALARTVDDNGGAYVVPAFSGLFAPHWRSDARGAIVGLTRFVNRGHLARAALEAAAFQSQEVIEAMAADSGVELSELKVDGGMVANELLMQFQADLLGVDVVRPVVAETTALGAAYAAGLAVGFWDSTAELVANWAEDKRWTPQMPDDERQRLLGQWAKAVQRTLDWETQ